MNEEIKNENVDTQEVVADVVKDAKEDEKKANMINRLFQFAA